MFDSAALDRISWLQFKTAIVAAGAICGLALSAPADAGPFTGTISGTWSAPVLSGNTLDGATGVPTFMNNTATAACDLTGCPVAVSGDPATTVAWGNGAFPPPNTSTLIFTGSAFINQPADTVFTLGTFTYTNGTSDLTSLIFGATLTLTLNDNVGGVIDTKAVPLQITTTGNTGAPAQNADFVQFPATPTTLNAASMNVFEGMTATFILQGEIVGDPTLSLVKVIIAPGSENAGFVGAGLPIPEPSTSALLGAALAGLALALIRRRPTGRA